MTTDGLPHQVRELLLELICAPTPGAAAAVPGAAVPGAVSGVASARLGVHLQSEAIAVLLAGERLWFAYPDERAHLSRACLVVLDALPPATRPTLPVALLASGLLRLFAYSPGASHALMPIPAPAPSPPAASVHSSGAADAPAVKRKVGFYCSPPQPKIVEHCPPPVGMHAPTGQAPDALIVPMLHAATLAAAAAAAAAAAGDADTPSAVMGSHESGGTRSVPVSGNAPLSPAVGNLSPAAAAVGNSLPLLVRSLRAHAAALLALETAPFGGDSILIWACAAVEELCGRASLDDRLHHDIPNASRALLQLV